MKNKLDKIQLNYLQPKDTEPITGEVNQLIHDILVDNTEPEVKTRAKFGSTALKTKPVSLKRKK